MTAHWTSALVRLDACDAAVEWCATQPDLATAWARCERGDWMLWLAGKLSGLVGSPERLRVVGAAADCAALALPVYEARYPRDARVRACIDTCRRYSRGEATLDEVRAATAAATYAAKARATAAAWAAAAATYAAADVADAAAADDARARTLSQCADIMRRHYPTPPELPT